MLSDNMYLCKRRSLIIHYLGYQPQPVPAFLDRLSSEVKLQGTGDQRRTALARLLHMLENLKIF